MRFPKRLLTLLTAVLLVCGMSFAAFAQETPDQSGSIQITMKKGETVVSGGTITLYRVGEASQTDGIYRFRVTGDFAAFDQALEDVQSPELAEALAEYVEANGLKGTTQEIDEEGETAFVDLELGLYLLVQEQAAEGYREVEPFLVPVPIWADGAYVNNVYANPKQGEIKPDTPDTPDTPDKPETPKPGTPVQTTLPQTGQLNWPVPVLVLAGLTLFTVGWMLRFGTGKKRDEK